MTQTRRRTREGHPLRPCEDWIDAVFNWIDGDTTTARARAITRHVAGCVRCRTFADDLRQAIALCRAAGDCRVPATIHRRAKARARAMLKAAGEKRNATGGGTP